MSIQILDVGDVGAGAAAGASGGGSVRPVKAAAGSRSEGFGVEKARAAATPSGTSGTATQQVLASVVRTARQRDLDLPPLIAAMLRAAEPVVPELLGLPPPPA